MSAPYHTDCWGLVKFIFHLFGFGTIGGVVGVSGITITETLFILLCSGQLSSMCVGLLANSYIYQLMLDNKTSRRYKALKLSQDSFLVSVSSRWSLGLLGVWYLVSVSVSLTLKKQDRTRYRYRSLKKHETRLGIGIDHFKKTRPDSVSVSFNFKKRDQTRYRYHSTSKSETRLGIGIVQLQKARPVSVSVPLKKWSRSTLKYCSCYEYIT